MQSFVCGKFVDRYVIASRFSNVGATIEKKLFFELVRLSARDDSKIPKWVNELLGKIGYVGLKPRRLNDMVLVRRPTNLNFGRASYEITESCNYRCGHCYLGRKSNKALSTSGKKRILEVIEKSGCLWLQITGGEPLVCKDFSEIYSFAYSLGFLITLSTNGSLLTKPHIAEILSFYPPYRLTISLYGATADSYEALTQASGSFQQFLVGLERVRETDIRTRLNIIVTKYNEREKDAMINLAKSSGFEYHIFPRLSPTLEGSSIPIEIMAQECEDTREDNRPITRKDHYAKCMAGKTFFHVNSLGKASICKIARELDVDLLEEGIDGLSKLPQIAEQSLRLPPICKSCTLRDSCTTCPPRLALYQRSSIVPSSICDRGDAICLGRR